MIHRLYNQLQRLEEIWLTPQDILVRKNRIITEQELVA